MDARFVSIGRSKWIDRGPVRTVLTRSGRKTGRYGLRRHVAGHDGELDRWLNRVETKWYWWPVVLCDSDPNNRISSLEVCGRGAAPVRMTSDKYQAMSDSEHERMM